MNNLKSKLIVFQINNQKINLMIKNKSMIQIPNKLNDKNINKKEQMEIIITKKITTLIHHNKNKVI